LLLALLSAGFATWGNVNQGLGYFRF
jgi:hypothetical protein